MLVSVWRRRVHVLLSFCSLLDVCAADAGDPYAAAFMGDVHHNGLRNAPIDHELAARYYQNAANGGFEAAKVQLAKMSVMGQVRRLDNATVLRYLNETEATHSEALSLKAHIKAHGLLGFKRDEGTTVTACSFVLNSGEPHASARVYSRCTGDFQTCRKDGRRCWAVLHQRWRDGAAAAAQRHGGAQLFCAGGRARRYAGLLLAWRDGASAARGRQRV